MKYKITVVMITLAVAFIGWRFAESPSIAQKTGDHDMHIETNAPSEVHDHDVHDAHDHEAEADAQDAHEDADMHDDHEGHDHDAQGHPEEGFIPLMNEIQAAEAGITTDTVKHGSISRQIKVTGEVGFNQDRTVHLVPRISGVVEAVYKKLGDPVKKGEVLAVIHSRELTDIKSEYLSAVERIENSKINFEREESLWKKKIIPERQYLESKQDYTETRIALQAAERKLHALGFSEQYIATLPDQSHETLFQYRLTAPADGIIIEKHMVQGELVTTESPVFIIADTTSLWVDLQVYPKDMASIKTGQKVSVSALDGTLTAEGILSFLSPVINQETRTALARVELSNTDDLWRAGLFATAIVTPEENNGTQTFVVPISAVQTIDGNPSVFIKTAEGYFPVTVKTGQSNTTHVEILSGIAEGQEYVATGSFELKAKLVTSQMDGHAGHGH